ncbi:transcriptional repressor p66-alpha-like isoform X2 [Myxocyprinus asiaticus]|uniref:transcriptional repressor p66-alpha-like isoform X2 n=1 Tax=Myxocyprinus asiaticus TaxID=70543 RepID=UPI002221A3E6|nr:transcriptional repressor p66-alpha-like isoform X2 [Myxocyprinus asiaticus]
MMVPRCSRARMLSAVTPRLEGVCVRERAAHYLAARRRSGAGRARARAVGFTGIIGVNYRSESPGRPPVLTAASPRPVPVMSEDVVRQTRSQKRVLDRDSQSVDVDSKRVKLECVDRDDTPALRSRSETAVSVQTSSMLSGGEVKATIKLELQTGNEPVDMSTSRTELKRENGPSSPDDVIVLSDNEASSPQVNGDSSCKELDTELLMRSSPVDRERVIKQLQEELWLEEAKLTLLKKLRQSQTHKDSGVQKVISGRASGTVIPPPLVRGGGQVTKPGSASAQIIMPPLVRGAQPISVTPQQIASLRQQQNSSSAPPPLLLASRASGPNVPGQKIIQPGIIRMSNIPNSSLLVTINQSTATNLKSSSVSTVNDSPASRQAAAKLALRKQLEKTLLEIPPAKPPVPKFNFLPSAANNEFIYLVGLEEAVQKLLESLGRGKQGVYAGLVVTGEEPFTCSQCQTDFTCRWRKDKGGAIMCEECMSSIQKKALKAEHTNRLKAAFVKALQQEQEMEKKILQQSSSPASSSSSSAAAAHVMKADQMKRSSTAVQQTHGRTNQPINRHSSNIKQISSSVLQLSRSMQQSVAGIRAVPHSFSPSTQLQNAVTAAALVSRPGKHAVHQGSKVSSSGSNKKSVPTTSSTWRKQNAAAAEDVIISGGASERISVRHDPLTLRLTDRKHVEIKICKHIHNPVREARLSPVWIGVLEQLQPESRTAPLEFSLEF